MGWEVCFARMCRKGSPGRSDSVSSSLPPPITTGARLPNPLSSPLQQPWQPLPSRSSLSIPRFPARPLEWGPSGLAGLGLLWSGVGGGDLLPPCSRTPRAMSWAALLGLLAALLLLLLLLSRRRAR